MTLPKDDRDDRANPFVAFRRFADQQMSSLMTTVFGASQSSPIQRQRALDDYENTLRKLRGESTDHESSATLDARRRVTDLYIRANQDNTEFADTTKPTRDDQDAGDGLEGTRCPYRPTDDSTSLPTPPQPSAIDATYLWSSPYSPLALEADFVLSQEGGKWRAAFADLLAMQAGGDVMLGNDPKAHERLSPTVWTGALLSGVAIGRQDMNDKCSRLSNRSDFFEDMLAKQRLLRTLGLAWRQFEEDGEKEGQARIGEDGDHDWEDIPICRTLKKYICESEEKPSAEPKEALGGALRLITADADDNDDDDDDYYYDDEEDEDDDEYSSPTSYLSHHSRSHDQRHLDILQTVRDQWHAHAKDTSNNPTSTELDHYNPHQLEPNSSIQPSVPEPQHQSPNDQPQQTPSSTTPQQPSLLSTLTTTEQRTLPDGTTTTKIVLKKRFSDGAEESTEKVYTQNASAALAGSGPAKTVNSEVTKSQGAEKQPKTKEEGKRKGWFWS